MNNKKINTTALVRHLIQFAAFILFPGFFIMTFTGIKTIATTIINGTWTVQGMGSTTIMVAGVLLLTALIGRFFCGFLCSFGAMGDLLHFIGKSIGLPQVKVPHDIDAPLKYVKYIVLMAVVVFGWIFGLSTFSGTNDPWTVFGMAFTIKNPSFAALLSVGGAILAAIFIASLFIERFFCRYLCPLGGIFAVISKVRLFRLKKPCDNCGKCSLCTYNCSMGIDLRENDVIDSGECIDCIECKATCPKKNINAALNPTTAAVVTAAALTGCYYAGNITIPAASNTTSVVAESGSVNTSDTGSNTTDGTESSASDYNESTQDSTGTESQTNSTENNTASTDQTGSAADSTTGSTTGTYKDGTYTGSGQGFRGTTNVTVTVSGGKISDITVDSYQDDDQFFSRAQSGIISEVIDAQSIDVATVSGATFSSQGLLSAIADALGLDYTAPVTNTEGGHGFH